MPFSTFLPFFHLNSHSGRSNTPSTHHRAKIGPSSDVTGATIAGMRRTCCAGISAACTRSSTRTSASATSARTRQDLRQICKLTSRGSIPSTTSPGTRSNRNSSKPESKLRLGQLYLFHYCAMIFSKIDSKNSVCHSLEFYLFFPLTSQSVGQRAV